MDVRYSFLPNEINPMWGVEISKQDIDEGNLDAYADYQMIRNVDERTGKAYFEMLFN
jgi:hypothetical protein